MRNILKLLIIVCTLIQCGCAASLHYGPRVPGFRPGYVERQLGETTYQIRVGEAWPKDWPDLEKVGMYRAAEITNSKGFRYFAIISASGQTTNYTALTPITTTTSGSVVNGNFMATSVSTGGNTISVSGGWYTLDFRLVSEAELGKFNRVVDSQAVINDLRYFIDSIR